MVSAFVIFLNFVIFLRISLSTSFICSIGGIPLKNLCIAPLYFGFQCGCSIVGEYVHPTFVLSNWFFAPDGKIVSKNKSLYSLLSDPTGMSFMLYNSKVIAFAPIMPCYTILYSYRPA